MQSLWITYAFLHLKIQILLTIVKRIFLFGVIQFKVNVTITLHVRSGKVNPQEKGLLNELVSLFFINTKSSNASYLRHVTHSVKFSTMAFFPDFETFGYKRQISSRARLIVNTVNGQFSSRLRFSKISCALSSLGFRKLIENNANVLRTMDTLKSVLQ